MTAVVIDKGISNVLQKVLYPTATLITNKSENDKICKKFITDEYFLQFLCLVRGRSVMGSLEVSKKALMHISCYRFATALKIL